MSASHDIAIAGAGIFGVMTALELRRRGYTVALIDPGPIPHPLAESTDISKVVRLSYGPDEDYAVLAEESRRGWLALNEELGEALYHETGVLWVLRRPMQPGSHEAESVRILQVRGLPVERLDEQTIRERYPAFKPGVYVDGCFEPQGGWVESGRMVEALAAMARRQGVTLLPDSPVEALIEENGAIAGLRTAAGDAIQVSHVVLCTGACTSTLLPELKDVLVANGQPVFHLTPVQPELFAAPNLPVFAADISATGWYGFPLHPRHGVVKVANHGPGLRLHPSRDPRVVMDEDHQHLRAFLAESMPGLADAPVVYTRRCVYCDTPDGHFWIARHPERAGLTIAAGGSGHAFKFGPALGPIIADVVEGKANLYASKFAWREVAVVDRTGDSARASQ